VKTLGKIVIVSAGVLNPLPSKQAVRTAVVLLHNQGSYQFNAK
jgi:hypothetical protein